MESLTPENGTKRARPAAARFLEFRSGWFGIAIVKIETQMRCFHNEEWENRTEQSLCNITSNGWRTKAIHLHPLKSQSPVLSWRLVLILQWKFTNWLLLFFCTHYHISGPTRQWIECASNFPAALLPSFFVVTLTSINGIINTSIGYFFWQTSNTKGVFEGCSKLSRTKCKLPCPSSSHSHRVCGVVCPSLSCWHRVSWVVAFDSKFV